MDWLAAHPERRADPRELWRDVRSIVMLGVNYGPDENPLAILERRTRGAISVYAQGDDYHDLIKKRLKALARWLVAAAGCEVKVFVDTAAVMEKPLAQAAGLGWQGKHTNLVSREFGSWLFLGAIFTTLELPRDDGRASIIAAPAAPASTSVRRRRFPRPTSSMRGAAFPISPSRTRGRSRANSAKPSATASMAATIASRCARGTSSRKPAARRNSPRATNLRAPDLAELARLDDAAFRALFAKSPVKRIGRDRFVRNVLIAIGNSNDRALGRRAPSACSTTTARWCAAPRCGRCRNCWTREEFCGARRRRWRRDGRDRARGMAARKQRCQTLILRERRSAPCVSKDEPAPGLMVRDGARAPPHHEDHALDFIAQIPSWSRPMTNQPFFTRDRDAFMPTPVASGPWDPKSLHGRVIIGLLAFVIEQRHGADDFVPARLTVDMFRLPTFAPIEVKTRLVRDGLRIKVVEADFFSGGVAMARASCQLLRKTENPQGRVWSPPNWEVPAPADIPAPTDPQARHERQMDDPPDRRRDGHRRPAAAVDERGARPRRGRAADAVRAGRGGGGFRQPLRQCRRPGPRLHQQRRHAVSASPAGDRNGSASRW